MEMNNWRRQERAWIRFRMASRAWLCLWLDKRATCPWCSFILPGAACRVHESFKTSQAFVHKIFVCLLPSSSSICSCSSSLFSVHNILTLCFWWLYSHRSWRLLILSHKQKLLTLREHISSSYSSMYQPPTWALIPTQPQTIVQISHAILHVGKPNAEDSQIPEDSRYFWKHSHQ